MPHRMIVAMLMIHLIVASIDAIAEDVPQTTDRASTVDPAELKALDRDITQADAAAAREDWDAALAYVDFTGHEEKAFAKGVLRYGAAQAAVHKAVLIKFGATGWTQAARTMHLSEGPRDEKLAHTGRLVDGVLFARSSRAGAEVPYVKIDGAWKLSVRDVIFQSLKSAQKKNSKDGHEEEIEEAKVFAVAGSIAKVLDSKSDAIESLTADLRDGTFDSIEAFSRAAAERLSTKSLPDREKVSSKK